MPSCGEIGAGSLYDCSNPLQGGANPLVRLFNLDDIEGYTIDGSTPNLLTALDFKTGKQAWKFEGFGKSVTPQQDVIKLGSAQNVYKHQVGIIIFGRDQVTKNTIQKLVLGRFGAIVESTKKDANAYEVYGLGTGLELVPGTIQQLQENNGAYTIVLATPDGSSEALLPQTLYVTSYAATKTLVESYDTPAS
jgi:hypothetical protein